jgi:hypothetical protein
MEDLFCSQVSQQVGEQLFGTAVASIKTWFLLEYNRPWQAKATDDNELPTTVQSWLREQLDLVGNGRLQFIRQHNATAALSFFIALPADKRVYRFELDSYEDLLALDVASIVAGAAEYDSCQWSQPLYLVCTNGKRDRCCALWGMAYFRALQPLVGTAVWQTTHTGGHRFAPTMLTLPDGVMHGRLAVENVTEFLAAHQQGQIILDNFRGQAKYEPVVQAADYFLRRETGETAVTAFHYQQHHNGNGSEWRVRFMTDDNKVHEIAMEVETAVPDNLLASCGKPQVKPISHYTYLSHSVVGPR